MLGFLLVFYLHIPNQFPLFFLQLKVALHLFRIHWTRQNGTFCYATTQRLAKTGVAESFVILEIRGGERDTLV
jgi:hypothetical protein